MSYYADVLIMWRDKNAPPFYKTMYKNFKSMLNRCKIVIFSSCFA